MHAEDIKRMAEICGPMWQKKSNVKYPNVWCSVYFIWRMAILDHLYLYHKRPNVWLVVHLDYSRSGFMSEGQIDRCTPQPSFHALTVTDSLLKVWVDADLKSCLCGVSPLISASSLGLSAAKCRFEVKLETQNFPHLLNGADSESKSTLLARFVHANQEIDFIWGKY